MKLPALSLPVCLTARVAKLLTGTAETPEAVDSVGLPSLVPHPPPRPRLRNPLLLKPPSTFDYGDADIFDHNDPRIVWKSWRHLAASCHQQLTRSGPQRVMGLMEQALASC